MLTILGYIAFGYVIVLLLILLSHSGSKPN